MYAWDNLQSMTKPCHDRKTATIDGGFGHQKGNPNMTTPDPAPDEPGKDNDEPAKVTRPRMTPTTPTSPPREAQTSP